MPHCESCAHKLPEDVVFCPFCGQSVDSELEPGIEEPATVQLNMPEQSEKAWQLMIVRPDGAQVSAMLHGRLRIGRSSQNDLQLQDPQASRYHAVIEKTGPKFHINDLGSTNGTFINRKQLVGSAPLRVGDVVTIGSYRLLVQRASNNCSHCGRRVKSDYIFCHYCGEPVSGVPREYQKPKSEQIADNLPTDPLEMPVLSETKPDQSAVEIDHDTPSVSMTAPEIPMPAQPPPAANQTARPGVSEPPSQTTRPHREIQPDSVPKISPLPTPPPRQSPPTAPSPAPSGTVHQTHPAPTNATTRAPVRQAELQPQNDERVDRWIKGIAVVGVIGVCLLAALAFAGYLLYVNLVLP